MIVKSYKELIVWQKSMELVKLIYNLTEKFPRNEIYGLSSQMQRAAVAIPSNIAEGYLRRSKKEYAYFLSISLGSSAELETQILISKSIMKFADQLYEDIENLLTEVMKMLYTMIERLKS